MSEDRRRAAGRLLKAMLPSAVVAAPYVVLALYYITRYDLPANFPDRLDYIPEPISFVLPLTISSIHSGWFLDEPLRAFPPQALLGNYPALTRPGLACYLGWLVAPMAMVGLVRRRRDQEVGLCLVLLLLFVVLALGPVLLSNREVVRIFGLPIPLPFALWRKIPALGEVAQSGRYMVISYMALAAGVACMLAAVRARSTARWATLSALTAAILICIDFGFRTWTSKLPGVPPMSDRSGAVLDPRLRSGYPMFYQTRHERPVVGGYLARIPPQPMQRYGRVTGFKCLFFGDLTADCSRAAVMEGLTRLNVTDVTFGPLDWRNDLVRTMGFAQRYADRYSVVWSVPGT